MPIEYYSPVSGGAISTIIAQVAKELVASGERISVLTPVDKNPLYTIGDVRPLRFQARDEMGLVRGKISGLRRRLNGWDWPGFDTYLDAAITSLKSIEPDAVIIFNDLVTQRYIRKALPEATVVSWLQNEWRTNQRSKTASIDATDLFFTCSDYIREWTHNAHDIPIEKLRTVHSGVDLESFSPRASESEDLRVLFVGRMDPNKGPDIAADAVAALRAEGLNISLTVAGGTWFYTKEGAKEDPYLKTVSEKVAAAGGTMLGHVTRDRMPEVFRSHDVVCVLSRSREPFGLVVLEAMASGCAVLSSNRGGLPEACGDAAELVNPDDLEAVIAQLRRWATNRSALTESKRKSLERASRSSWSKVAGEVRAALEEVSRVAVTK